MIAGFQYREQRRADGRSPGGRDADASALRAFQYHHRVLQRPGRRGAAAAILELAAMGTQIVGGRIEHCRTMDDGRIDEALLRLAVTTRGHEQGFRLQRARWSVIPGKTHAFTAKDLLPQPQRIKPARRRVRAGFVNNRTQKSAVNPLTRHASRSVMRANTSSRRTLRGLPRP